MSDRPTYRITLTALPGFAGTTMSRLRMALKCLLRTFGFKCLEIQEVKPNAKDVGIVLAGISLADVERPQLEEVQ